MIKQEGRTIAVSNNVKSLFLFPVIAICFLLLVFLPATIEDKFFISSWVVVGAYIIAIVLIAATSAKIDWIALLGMVLIGFVRFEPAPADIIFSILLLILLLSRKYDQIKTPALIHFFLFLFIITNLTSLQNIADYSAAVLYFIISAYLVGFFYLLKMYATSEKRVSLLATGYVASAAISVIASFAGLLGIGTEFVLYGGRYWTDNYFRIQGFFKDPNVFGPFLVPAIIIIVESLFNRDFLKINIVVKIGLLLLVASGLILSFSRAALLNLFIALVVYFAIKAYKNQLTKKFIAIAITIFISFSFLFFVTQSWLSVNNANSNSILSSRNTGYDTERFESQGKALSISLNSPLGLGPGQFPLYNKIGTHELYLKLLSEQGILGFAGFIGLILFIIIKVAQSGFGDNKIIFSLSLIVISSLSGILANSFFIDTLHWRHFWFLLALGWVGLEFAKHNKVVRSAL